MSLLRNAVTLLALTGPLALTSLVMSCGLASADSRMDWDAVAECESGGDWDANTGNGHYGGLQIKQATWTANGGTGTPHAASRDEQIRVAENVVAKQGADAFGSCGAATLPAESAVFTQPVSPGTATAPVAAPAAPVTQSPVPVSTTPAQSACQGIGRGPFGLVDFGKICQAWSSAFSQR